ncbi:hypothetical protein PS2_011662 [Malus domestica]
MADSIPCLKSCEDLLPMAEDLKIVQKCVDVATSKASSTCKTELERRILSVLEHVTVDDLLVLLFTYDGGRLFDLKSVRRIISGFVEKEKSIAVFNAGDFREVCSGPIRRDPTGCSGLCQRAEKSHLPEPTS